MRNFLGPSHSLEIVPERERQREDINRTFTKKTHTITQSQTTQSQNKIVFFIIQRKRIKPMGLVDDEVVMTFEEFLFLSSFVWIEFNFVSSEVESEELSSSPAALVFGFFGRFTLV